MTYLLDVNVLIALLDPKHVAHESAQLWFEHVGRTSFATCPMTQNGFVRIATGPKYPTPIGSMSQVMASLDRQISLPGHIFWSEDISLISSSVVQRDAIKVSSQVTDTYLLALAATRGGKLATFDRRISTGAVCGGPETLEVIPVGRS